jgi:polysaccharide chain length determinant protein (PEP-CTERM system associated)
VYELFAKLLEQVRGAWRFRWLALGVAWLVCLLGWAMVLTMPDVYEASTRVFVDTRTTLSRVTQGMTVESNIETQILRVRQSLLSNPELEAVMRDTGFPLEGLTPQELQGRIAGLRERIEITGTTAQYSSSGGVFTLVYRDEDRERALRVVQRLVDSFVSDSQSGKREGTEQAQQFLVKQIRDYEQRLSAAEGRLAGFKKNNVGLMPGAQGGYFTRLQGEIDGLGQARDKLAIAERRRDELQRQLRGEQPVVVSDVPSTTPVPGATDTASRIRETQTRLDELLLRYTERHPDVVALRETLAGLKARQQQEIETLKSSGGAPGSGMASNPVFQDIQLRLNQAEVDIAALRAEVIDRQGKVAELRRLVDTAPEVEAELARLDRDYEVTHAQYRALVERLEKTRLSEQAEETGAVQFDVIDPPAAPFYPVAPKRGLLAVAILFFGMGAGGGLAWLLHQLRPVFIDARQLNEVTGLPVLGMVSMTWLEKHKARRVRRVFAYAAAAGMLLFVAAVMVAVQRPIVDLLHRWLG